MLFYIFVGIYFLTLLTIENDKYLKKSDQRNS